MSREKLLGLAAVCGVLGVVDLGILNLWLVPAAWPVNAQATAEPLALADRHKAAAPGVSAEPAALSSAPVAQQPGKPPQTEPKPQAEPEPTPKPKPKPQAEPEPTPKPKPKLRAAKPPLDAEPGPPMSVLGFSFLEFVYGKGLCEVTREMKTVLDPRLVRLAQHPEFVVVIEGHTDGTGKGHGNLSALRAKHMADYFVERGVDPSRIIQRAYGDAMAQHEGKTDSRKHRRVVIRIFSKR